MEGSNPEIDKQALRKVLVPGNSYHQGDLIKGYFHKWIVESYQDEGVQQNHNYALIEYEDGKVGYVDPRKIIFVDSF